MQNRVLTNFTRVLRGRGIAGICSVLATGLMANALPVEQFGLVILLHTYIMVIKGFVNFRTFEAIVRFGIPMHDRGDEGKLKSLLRSTVVVDLSSTLVATLIALAAVPVATWALHWGAQIGHWAMWYSLALLTTPVNTGSGILRLYDRFDVLGMQHAIGPLVRVVLVAIAWSVDAPMVVFIVVWGMGFCLGNLFMILRGFAELRGKLQTPLWQGFRWHDLREQGSSFWKFIGVVYWQTNVDLIPKHLSTLLAGNLLGPAAAGLFRLARETSSILTQPAVTLREVLFPDLTRAWNARETSFSQLAFKTALIAGTAGLACAAFAYVAGTPVLALVGADYVPAKPLMVLLLIAASFDLASASLRAAAYAMGHAARLLRISLLGIAVYVVSFYLFTSYFDLIGPGLASICAMLLTLGLNIRLVKGLR
jgi:O-antigen/teichoic acid export membrane protein